MAHVRFAWVRGRSGQVESYALQSDALRCIGDPLPWGRAAWRILSTQYHKLSPSTSVAIPSPRRFLCICGGGVDCGRESWSGWPGMSWQAGQAGKPLCQVASGSRSACVCSPVLVNTALCGVKYQVKRSQRGQSSPAATSADRVVPHLLRKGLALNTL